MGGAGLKAERSLYRPFGEEASTRFDLSVAPETKGFIGERHDADAGLQYLNARYYDPKLGLFLQPDWWEVTQAGVGTNRYSYSGNDPINGADPSGNGFWSDLKQSFKDTWQSIKDTFNGNVVRINNSGQWGTDGSYGVVHVDGTTYGCFGCGGSGNHRYQVSAALAYDSNQNVTLSTQSGPSRPLRYGQIVSPAAQFRQAMYWQAQWVIRAERERVGLPIRAGMYAHNFVPTASQVAAARREAAILKALPSNLVQTLERIRTGGTHPHRRDGAEHKNLEGNLPTRPNDYYTEWVVPTPGETPGARRIVTGQNGEI